MLTSLPASWAHACSWESLGDVGGSSMSLCRWSRGGDSVHPRCCVGSLLLTSRWALFGPDSWDCAGGCGVQELESSTDLSSAVTC